MSDADVLKLSTTSFSAAARCLKAYYYRYVLGLVPKPRLVRNPLRRGIWIHSCLEFHHRGWDWREILGALVEQAREWSIDEGKIATFRAEVADTMEQYVDFWSAEHEEPSFTMTKVEKELTCRIGDLEISATLDGLAYNAWGNGIVEHKSAQEIPSSSWRAIDPQTAIQFFVAMEHGYRPQWVLFNYVLTVKPSVPQVRKDGRFYDRQVQTTTRAFEKAIPTVRKDWKPYPVPCDQYIELMRREMVNDGRFFQRYIVLKPYPFIRETFRDVKAVRDIIRLSRQTGHWPRAWHPFTCRKFCNYAELDATEYVLGRASGLREELFDIDDGTREGDTARARLLAKVGLGVFGEED